MRLMKQQDAGIAFVCCLCGVSVPNTGFWRFGNNPYPCASKGRCCNECNATKVIPARVAQMFRPRKGEGNADT